MTTESVRSIRNERARGLQGTRAGFVSRATAAVIDWLIVNGIYLFILACIAVARYLLVGGQLELPKPNLLVTGYAVVALSTIYLTAGWSGTGRTIGNSIMGLRVVQSDGRRVHVVRAFLRALFCVMLWMVTLPWVIVSRRNAGIHDHVFRTVVLYDWRG